MPDLIMFLKTEIERDAVSATMQEIHTRDCETLPTYDMYTFPCNCGVPERMMREVQAKRAILARHNSCDDWSYGDPATCPELCILAAVYSDRPGYDPVWQDA